MSTILLLIVSNVFMTFAWYGHLKHRDVSLWKVILISWLIALPEYIFQVPANRMGYGQFTAIELKTIQEVITLSVFIIFSTFYLQESVKWNHLAGFGLILAAVYVTFKEW
ncbi:MAG TPA: DMT family protein [Chlorobiota bacterium]|nr:DMT family protein [Chlorobiota bacterium]